ncbi:MAG: GYD domain-containing protein [Chloroflexi bacterium]|nr:GYD domain-containing protein [Chloroflexota bacterium]
MTYVVLANFTDQGIKNIKDSPKRVDAMEQVIQKAGGKLIGFYATMGQYDLVMIAEGPSDEVAFTQLITMGMLGNVRTITLKAFTRQEYAKILGKL